MRRAVLLLALACPASAQAVSEPPPRTLAPGAVAPGGRVEVGSRGLERPVRVEVRRGDRWVVQGAPITRYGARAVVRAPLHARSLTVRARSVAGRAAPARRIRIRPLTLAAVGDVNLGDLPGAQIARYGAAWPWTSVGPRLSRADIAFANLECAVSVRGTAQPKTFTFRGRPSSARAMARVGGIDVVNLANNHAGDFGADALLDTLRHARRDGMTPVGAGHTEASAYRPAVVERLGLRIAFAGFSEIGPFSFAARGSRPGTAWAFPDRVRSGVRAARRQGDVVIATFHWGIERDRHESARQRELARVALAAGADAVIGAHPHVLQPIRRLPRRLIAYSLGNFVFGAHSPGTANTGILELELAADGVRGDRFLPATIRAGRPILHR